MENEQEKKRRAPPVKFTKELGDLICNRVSNGESTITICKEDGMPSKGTLFRWLREHEEFRDQYAQAKQDLAHFWAEETIEIADNAKPIDGRVDKPRLQVDARKWIVSKLLPKVYSEKHIAEITGRDGGPVQMAVGLRDLHERVMADEEKRNRGEDGGES